MAAIGDETEDANDVRAKSDRKTGKILDAVDVITYTISGKEWCDFLVRASSWFLKLMFGATDTNNSYRRAHNPLDILGF